MTKLQTAPSCDERIAQLEHRPGAMEGSQAIRRLQHARGYFPEKCRSLLVAGEFWKVSPDA